MVLSKMQGLRSRHKADVDIQGTQNSHPVSEAFPKEGIFPGKIQHVIIRIRIDSLSSL